MSSQLANDIFGDAQTAEIVATAGGVDSIPKLHGLPEVRRATCIRLSQLTSIR
jgi:hypothetical protein